MTLLRIYLIRLCIVVFFWIASLSFRCQPLSGRPLVPGFKSVISFLCPIVSASPGEVFRLGLFMRIIVFIEKSWISELIVVFSLLRLPFRRPLIFIIGFLILLFPFWRSLFLVFVVRISCSLLLHRCFSCSRGKDDFSEWFLRLLSVDKRVFRHIDRVFFLGLRLNKLLWWLGRLLRYSALLVRGPVLLIDRLPLWFVFKVYKFLGHLRGIDRVTLLCLS